MRTAVFLQVRMASTRFPGKALAPLRGSTVIEQAMSRLAAVPCDAHFIVTDHASFGALRHLATGPWRVFAGPTDDVMLRFMECARENDIEVIVRATADNPLVDTTLAGRMLDISVWTSADATRIIGCTPGTAVEVVTRYALETMWPTAGPWQREHVMPAVYESMVLKTNTLWGWPTYREAVTVDTVEDLERVARILEAEG